MCLLYRARTSRSYVERNVHALMQRAVVAATMPTTMADPWAKTLTRIRRKVSDMKGLEARKGQVCSFSVDDGVALVIRSSGLCPVCKCNLHFHDYRPYCLYQFTFDRIDSSQPHGLKNCRVVCFNCNSRLAGLSEDSQLFRHNLEEQTRKFTCRHACHVVDGLPYLKRVGVDGRLLDDETPNLASS